MKRLALGFLLLIAFTTPVQATIVVKLAKVQNGVAVIEGTKAASNTDIFWEGERVTRANNRGSFSFKGKMPADCVGTVSDGTPVVVALQNCIAPAPVPETGQRTCYNFDYNVVNCAGTGQDGEFRKGVEWPSPRFVNNGNGTINDRLTGLIWLQHGACYGGGSQLTWFQAITLIDELNTTGTMNGSHCADTSKFGSHQDDWRMPNLRELISLVDYSKVPVMPSDLFVGFRNSYYYSSTTRAFDAADVWAVEFENGFVNAFSKNIINGDLIAVRGGN